MKRINKPILRLTGSLFLLTFLAFPEISNAQNAPKDSTLNRTVIIEQEYNPDIMDASKVNILPKVEEPTVAKKGIEYATSLLPIASFNSTDVITPFSKNFSQANAKRGYVRLGYGNYGNVDGKFSYLLDISKKDQLGIAAGIDGMNGKFDLGGDEKSKLKYYRSAVGIDYLHRFAKTDFNLAANWGLSNFNFHPDALISHQRFTSGDFHIGANSTDETLPIQFKAETNLMLYSRAHNAYYETSEYIPISMNETRVSTKADVTGAINDEQKVGLALQMDNLFYTKDYHENYTSLQLNPYYALDNDSWKLRLGANVDLSFGSGKAFQVSPDVDVQYVFNDSYVIYAKATGGRILNDFRQIEQFCPYAEILRYPVINNTYEQINGELGFKASPYTGIRFKLFGGYQNLKDDLYQVNEYWIPGPVTSFHLEQENTNNIYGGINFSYEYKNYFSLSAEGIYRHWDASNEALPFKPAFDFNLKTDIRPIPALLINLGYQYSMREKVQEERLSPVNNLYAGATYDLYKGLAVYAKLNNILNREYQYYYQYPTEGFNILGGISFSF